MQAHADTVTSGGDVGNAKKAFGEARRKFIRAELAYSQACTERKAAGEGMEKGAAELREYTTKLSLSRARATRARGNFERAERRLSLANQMLEIAQLGLKIAGPGADASTQRKCEDAEHEAGDAEARQGLRGGDSRT